MASSAHSPAFAQLGGKARNARKAELLCIAISVAGFGGLVGLDAAVAAMAGGLIAAGCNFGFTRLALASAPMSSDRFLLRMVAGEMVKLAVAACGFAIAIGVFSLAFGPMIATFIVGLLAFWITLGL